METQRLLLTALSHSDNAFFISLVNTPGWLKFIGNRNIYSTEDAQRYIQAILDTPLTSYWTVRLKTDQTPLGVVSLIKRDYLDSHDIGFAFLPQHTSKGYAYEAAHFILETLKKEQTHRILYATVLPENKSSIQLLTRLGFRFTKPLQPEEELLHLYELNLELHEKHPAS